MVAEMGSLANRVKADIQLHIVRDFGVTQSELDCLGDFG